MLTCPYCNTEVGEKYNFCRNCKRQVKCLQCKEPLEVNEVMCFVCGASSVTESASQTPMNEFTLEEKQTTKSSYRRINGRFSDAFGQNAAGLFGIQPQPRFIPELTRNVPPYQQHVLSLPVDDRNAFADQPADIFALEEQGRPPLQQDDGRDKALRFFEITGNDELIAKVTDYKGKTKKDQEQRFVILYVWAYSHIFSKAVPSRDHMNDAAKRAGLYDKNFATYFDQTAKTYLMASDGGYKLN